MHTLGQPRPGQSRHGEVFHGDRLVLADQPQGQLVMVVGPPVADLTVGDRDLMPGPVPVDRPLAFAGQRPLGLGKAPLGGVQAPRVGHLLDAAVAGRDGGEPGQA